MGVGFFSLDLIFSFFRSYFLRSGPLFSGLLRFYVTFTAFFSSSLRILYERLGFLVLIPASMLQFFLRFNVLKFSLLSFIVELTWVNQAIMSFSYSQ